MQKNQQLDLLRRETIVITRPQVEEKVEEEADNLSHDSDNDNDVENLKLQIYYYEELRKELEENLVDEQEASRQIAAEWEERTLDQEYKIKVMEDNVVTLAKES